MTKTKKQKNLKLPGGKIPITAPFMRYIYRTRSGMKGKNKIIKTIITIIMMNT